MNNLKLKRKVISPYEFKELCRRLEENPNNEEAWYRIFNEKLNKYICTIIIKRYENLLNFTTEYLAYTSDVI